MNLLGKTLVVTGVASGIGRETARLAIAAGARVIGLDLHAPAATTMEFVEIDLSSETSIAAAIGRLPERIDGVLNIAGVSGVHPIARILAVNFYGLRRFTESLLPRIGAGGSVVNVASIAAHGWRDRIAVLKTLLALPGMPDATTAFEATGVDPADCYPLSKELLVAWTLQAAIDWLPHRVRVNAISPGPVDTPILDQFRATLGEALVARNIASVGRAGLPYDMAPILLFLASDASRWLNGVNLPVDNGLDALHCLREFGLGDPAGV